MPSFFEFPLHHPCRLVQKKASSNHFFHIIPPSILPQNQPPPPRPLLKAWMSASHPQNNNYSSWSRILFRCPDLLLRGRTRASATTKSWRNDRISNPNTPLQVRRELHQLRDRNTIIGYAVQRRAQLSVPRPRQVHVVHRRDSEHDSCRLPCSSWAAVTRHEPLRSLLLLGPE
jgi:hypothetical protein